MKIHDLSGHLPIISIAGVDIPTYFLVISLSFCICLLWIVRRAEPHGIPRTRALDVTMIVWISGFIGARGFHILFEDPTYYFEAPFRMLEVWNGGFVWYGGVIIGASVGILYVLYKRWPLGAWLDFSAPFVALGYSLGRIACLLTGCCYGVVCVLPNGTRYRHPTQLHAILWEAAILAILLSLEKKRKLGRAPKWLLPSGRIFAVWVVLHSIGRIIMEVFRADPRGPSPLGLSPATWISLVLIALTLLLIRRSKPT